MIPFVNPSFALSLPPSDLEKNFETTANEKVVAFLVRVPRESVSMATYIHEVQEFLLRGLTNISVVGAYSNMHDYAAYTKGYAHPETLRLAHMQVVSFQFWAPVDNPFIGSVTSLTGQRLV